MNLNNAYDLLMKTSSMLVDVEYRGIKVDLDALKAASHTLKGLAAIPRKAMCDLIDDPFFNPNSPAQVAEAMYDVLHIPEQKIYGKAPRCTDAVVLDVLLDVDQSGFVELLHEYRHLDKVRSTYAEGIQPHLDSNNVLHTNFKIIGTETGRLSSSKPNIQNIPNPHSSDDVAAKLIRGCFIPRPGFNFVEADYSQNELRVIAAVSGDEEWLKIFNDGLDPHTEVAKSIFQTNTPTKDQRFLSKKFNFGIAYGADAGVISRQAKMPIERVTPLFNLYKQKFAHFEKWKLRQEQEMITKGFVTSRFGRCRRFPTIDKSNYKEAKRAAINFPIQSAGSDLMLWSAIALNAENMRIVNLVHDSILVECPIGRELEIGEVMKNVMIQTGEFYFPEVKYAADYEIKSRWWE